MNFFIRAIRAYQLLISPILGRHCRFYPSCSEYFKQAITSQGFPQGVKMGLFRILRCQPFTPGGYDPVPAEGKGICR